MPEHWFRPEVHVYREPEKPLGLKYIANRRIACDYGTTNPFVLLDVYDDGETVWVDDEYVWDSKAAQAGVEKPVKSMDHGGRTLCGTM